MAKVEALTIKEIDGVNVSDDGQYALLKLGLTSGTELTLAFPEDMLMPLMQCISHASEKAQKTHRNDPRVKLLLPVEWWEIAPHEDKVIMSFRMTGGMEMSFQIHRDAAMHFRETLSSVLGDKSVIPDKQISRH